MELDSYNMLIKISMLVPLIKESEREVVSISIVKEQHTMAFGAMIKRHKDSCDYLMETYSKDSLEVIWDIMGCIGIRMATLMKVLGKMILSKVLESLN